VTLALVEGRAVDVDHNVGAGEGLGLGRALGVPDVLADVDADFRARDLEDLRLGAGGEVALLVEDAVVGQELLVVDAGDLAIVDDGGGVKYVVVGVDEADYGRDAVNLGRGVVQRRLVIEDEAAAQQQVLGRVAGDRELREGNEVGAGLAGTVRVLDYLRGVALKVANGRVYLGERDS
jgi:hypothetical protein